ncbi:unnamed protein product [Durusdinium trenchii]|uniref:Uncharacterized protein n=2 Tax=Durusdinium trenchii TaxID=1381693 RepID=A0ABP0S005_9DINO
MEDVSPDTALIDLEQLGTTSAVGSAGRPIPWKKLSVAAVVIGTVAYLSWPKSSTTSAVKRSVQLSSWEDTLEECTNLFQMALDADEDSVQVGVFDYDDQTLAQEKIRTAEQAAKAMHDPETNFVQIGTCGMQERSVVWLYPDKSGDHDGDDHAAFLVADGECKRIEAQVNDKKSEAACIAVYRIPDPAAGIAVLNHFHGIGTISHAVVGGHGSDSAQKNGELQMSSDIDLSGKDPVALTLVDTLATKLTPHGTIFLDSCFAGINGIAEMFSKRIPDHWVMGGVVSLQSFIQVHDTPFDGTEASGPTQVTSELAFDQVVNPSEGIDAEGDPTFVKGMAFENGGKVEEIDQLKGERVVAWFGGQNRGSVTQWLYPSGDEEVLKVNCKVEVQEPFYAFRMGPAETEQTDEDAEDGDGEGLGVFEQLLPRGLEGWVVFIYDVGNAPTSGNALINYDLPKEFKEQGVTGGTGQTLGPLLTLTKDFSKLSVTCPE